MQLYNIFKGTLTVGIVSCPSVANIYNIYIHIHISHQSNWAFHRPVACAQRLCDLFFKNPLQLRSVSSLLYTQHFWNRFANSSQSGRLIYCAESNLALASRASVSSSSIRVIKSASTRCGVCWLPDKLASLCNWLARGLAGWHCMSDSIRERKECQDWRSLEFTDKTKTNSYNEVYPKIPPLATIEWEAQFDWSLNRNACRMINWLARAITKVFHILFSFKILRICKTTGEKDLNWRWSLKLIAKLNWRNLVCVNWLKVDLWVGWKWEFYTETI